MYVEKILVVDDEASTRRLMEQTLRKHGYEVITASSGDEGLRAVMDESPELILLDIQLPGMDGIEVLQKIREINKDIVVIMATAMDDLKVAVKAMRLGAYDYINKPFHIDNLILTVNKAMETSRLRREVATLKEERSRDLGIEKIIGISTHIQGILSMVKKISASEASTVLIQGESGTGKELIAKALHYESSRRERPFMAINCSAVPENLLESELMGHEKGAFTDAKAMRKGLFEMADGGTVFLDEIGDMPLQMQTKLLRILEERTFRRVGGTKDITVDVRVISATNKDLAKGAEDGSFRKDLYYRLQVIPIYLKPLRERKEDIIPLVRHFINYFNEKFRKNVKSISPSAEKLILEYSWPGNVRELKNVIERVMLLGDGDVLTGEHLPVEMTSKSQEGKEAFTFKLPPEGLSIEDVERELLKQALDMTSYNQTKAAKKLNIGVDALRYRMKKFGFL
ncbi:MAG TPA: sigma-54 dependent transcriptional regulator [Thermodesulfobacteriota bacterium]|nr:sigma-54 dependent transcriptional regulator [Thermodesulfobacteriota bacterium]